MSNSQLNWLSPQFRLYVWKALSKTREIRCEKCGSYEGIELHHEKYAPKENVSINDIKLLCNKCHRNDSKIKSKVKTVFENGKRFCVGPNFKFKYLFIVFCLITLTTFATAEIQLPSHEIKIINEVADEYNLTGESRLLLFVIRKVENGGSGREFGVLHPKAINTTFRNQAQWAAGTIKKRYAGDLKAFAQRWCPIGAENDPAGLNKNWYKNANYYMKKWGEK